MHYLADEFDRVPEDVKWLLMRFARYAQGHQTEGLMFTPDECLTIATYVSILLEQSRIGCMMVEIETARLRTSPHPPMLSLDRP